MSGDPQRGGSPGDRDATSSALPGQRSLRIGYVVEQPLSEMPENLGHKIYVTVMARALAEAGHEVVFLNRDWSSMRRVDPRTGAADEVPGWWNTDHRGRERLRRWTRGLSESVRFAAACRAAFEGVDVIHEHFGALRLGGSWAARRPGVPYVLQVHGDDLAERLLMGQRLGVFRRTILGWASRASFRAADAIVAVSPAVRDRLVRVWGVAAQRIHVLDNAVEEEFFREDHDTASLRSDLGLEPGDRLVTFVGSFHAWYDLVLLVRAFAELLRRYPEARLVLAGDGAGRAVVEAACLETGLGDRVLLPGCLEHRRIPALLAASEVAVVPVRSMKEEFWCSPMKIFEAMAVGVPIVASAVGVVPRLLGDGRFGRLVGAGDVAAMSGALVEVFEGREAARDLADAARGAAREHTWARYVERVTMVHRRAMEQATAEG